jgi:osmotically-inducible protein OsmY
METNMNRLFLASFTICLSCIVASAQTPPLPQSQPGTAAQIGEKIDRGLNQIGAEISQAWAEVRKSVEKMGVQGRVYGRLHWDKALESGTFDIEVRDGQVVVLKGKVDTASAKLKAEQLARDTIGVTSVVNELAVTSVSSP